MPDDQSEFLCSEALDDPVAASFGAHWSAIAHQVGTARVLPADIGAFASFGGDNQADQQDFTKMVRARKSPVILLKKSDIPVPNGLLTLQTWRGVQMVPTQPICTQYDVQFDDLGATDAPEMLRLAQMTRPGPFELNTRLLGDFIGVRKDGMLVAMAGQRMAFADWIEISGVCVHPDFRKRSLARRLVTAMMDRIQHNGASPFLHTYADNTDAIALYRRLGFEIRTEVNIAQIT